MRRLLAIVLICICCFSAFSAPSLERYVQYTSSSGNAANKASAAQAATLSELMYALGNLYTYLDQNFLYEIDNQKMQDAVISAMIDSLGDKYSYYVKPEDAASYAEDNRGKYVGIGTYVSKVNPKYIDWDDPTTYMLQIVSPFPGGPADRAGLRAGDLISHADGEELYEMDATAASRRIRGVYGQSITLTVHRGSSVFDITLNPEVVTTPSTSKCILSDDIGYLAITEFSMSTYESVVEDLNSLLEDGAKSLIIDVRNNGGGIVDAALNIANLFVPEGNVLLTTKFKENSGNKDAIYMSSGPTIVPEDFPVVILANGGTASASEILTAAIQQNGRAKIIGSQTFGKGIMQYSISFMGGYMNVTVANYYTPDGNSIHEIGITPDYELNADTEYTDEELDAYAAFLKEDYIQTWLTDYPDYTKENILAFADFYKDSGVPTELLCLLVRNEYIYSLEYDKRPVADPDFDTQLKKAMEVIRDMESIIEEPETAQEVEAE